MQQLFSYILYRLQYRNEVWSTTLKMIHRSKVIDITGQLHVIPECGQEAEGPT